MTADEFGNNALTSGSSTTTFVPSRYRAADAPRTAAEKSYSSRIVSRSAWASWVGSLTRRGVFFIAAPLGAASETSTDDSRALAAHRIGYYQQAAVVRKAHYEVTIFVYRVIWIGHAQRQRISEHFSAFVEGYPVLSRVLFGFLRTPFEEVGQLRPAALVCALLKGG